MNHEMIAPLIMIQSATRAIVKRTYTFYYFEEYTAIATILQFYKNSSGKYFEKKSINYSA